MANENMDMKRMQEEAIHRVQEMQNRANQQLRGAPPFAAPPRTNRTNNGPSFSSGTHGNHTEEPPHHTPNEQGGPLHGHNGDTPPNVPSVPAGPQNIVENLLDGVMKDSERTLIMILLLVLFNEQADTSVIFSLLYLLL